MISIVEHLAVIALLVTILSNFSDCDYCPASAPTVSVVSKCPTNKTEWDQAASRKKCSHMSAKCGDKSPVYHCLLNQWGNETLEVCASTWYISGFCAIYNTDEMKVIDDFETDCTKFSEGKCPSRYISSEAYLYQKCYMQESSNTIPLPDRPIGTEETNDCIMSSVIAIVVTVLVLAITSLVVFITLRLKISKKAPDEKAPDEECMPFCNASTQIVEESEKKTLLEKNVNEENRVNPTKKTAESSSCGDSVESKPETAETCGVDYSKPRPFNYLRSQYEGRKTRNQTPNESVTNSSNAKPKDKENAVPIELFQKEVEPKVEHTTKNNHEFSSRKNINSEENTDEDPAAEKGHAVQKDVKQKADQTIRSHRNFINEVENVEEREKFPDPSPSEKRIKAPSTEAKDFAADANNAAENEDDETINHTTMNDVEFSSHENPIDEENEDVNTQSPDSTLREEDDQKVDHTTKNDVEFSSHENPTNEENEDVNTKSPESTPRESVKNTTTAKSTEFKQNADDKDDGGDSSDRMVQKRKKFFEGIGLKPE